jgi:hypothetical protein
MSTLKLLLSKPWRHIGGAEIQIHSLLTLVTDGGEWSTSSPSHFSPEREPWYSLNRRLYGSHSKNGWFWNEKDLVPTRIWTPNRLACSLITTPTTLSLKLICPSKPSRYWYIKWWLKQRCNSGHESLSVHTNYGHISNWTDRNTAESLDIRILHIRRNNEWNNHQWSECTPV